MPATGVDSTWEYGLNQAVAQGYVFGRDLIFTYGPLASLGTIMFHPATYPLTVVGSIIFAIGFCSAFALICAPKRRLLFIFLPVCLALCLSRDCEFLFLPIILLIVAVRASLPAAASFQLMSTPLVIVGIGLTSSAVALTPLVKASFSIVTLPICGLTFLVLLLRNCWAAFVFATVTAGVLLGAWWLTGQPLDALPWYFVAQDPIISGYSDAMSVDGPLWPILTYATASSILLVTFYMHFTRKTGWRGWVALLGLAWVLFVTYKAAFIRQDWWHIIIAAGVLLLTGYALALLSSARVALFVALVTVIASSAICGMVPTDHRIANQIVNAWQKTISGITAHFRDPDALQRQFIAANDKIRAEVPLNHVGGSVDLYPTELAAIFANKLNWSGRPTPQSYAVYDPRLDAQNVAHLTSPNGPNTVFFKFAPVTGQLPALEDAGSLLYLLTGYDVVGSSGSYVQMTRRAASNGSPLEHTKTRIVEGKLNSNIEIGSADPTWVALDIHPTLLGRLIAAVYKLPILRITLTLGNGRIVQRRYVPGSGNAGFIISPYLSTSNDLIRLAAGLDGAPRVTSFCITSSKEDLWSSQFTARLTPIRLDPQSSARALALAEAAEQSEILSKP
jgi:hypothetical protein